MAALPVVYAVTEPDGYVHSIWPTRTEAQDQARECSEERQLAFEVEAFVVGPPRWGGTGAVFPGGIRGDEPGLVQAVTEVAAWVRSGGDGLMASAIALNAPASAVDEFARQVARVAVIAFARGAYADASGGEPPPEAPGGRERQAGAVLVPVVECSGCHCLVAEGSWPAHLRIHRAAEAHANPRPIEVP